MEKFSDRNDRIKTGIINFFKKIDRWGKRNKKLVFALWVGFFVCLLSIVVVRIFVMKETNETNMVAESAQEVLGVEEEQVKAIEEVPLEKDKYVELNLFFADYFASLAEGNKDTVLNARTEMDDLEWIKILKKSDFVESYQNLACYTKPGPFDDTYVCYVYYEVKFHDLEELVPGLSTMYVIKDGENYRVECSEIEDDVQTYLISISKQEDVVDLFRKVQVEYNDLVASNPEVEVYLTELPDQIIVEVAKELASISDETVETEEIVEEEDVVSEEVVEEVIIQTVKATTTVNVRKSDSTTAERIGKVQEGSELTCLENLDNGWSKIIYEDQEAYIKTEYLEVVEEKVVEAGAAVEGTMVTTTDNVHIRKEASINAENIGAALAGETFELLENLDSGWSKILFNGEEAYIKSDYLDL